ncbi:hypothetical protein P7C70_g6654, partial [Phenoliferia sp. Uapishka_3]
MSAGFTHPLDLAIASVSGPLPSPPLSPGDERDIELGKDDLAQPQAYANAVSYSENTESDRDPLLLKSGLQTAEHINALRRRKQTKSKRGLGDFYLKQNEQIGNLLKSMDDHIQDAQDEEDTNRTAGGSKFETIGDIVYSGVMGAVSVILVAFAIQDLVKGDPGDKQLHIPAIAGTVALALSLAGIEPCYIHSRRSRLRYKAFPLPLLLLNSVQEFTIAADALNSSSRNDLFINGFGLFTSTAGVKIKWFIDPLGALMVLILVWGKTCYSHFQYLAGKAAPLEFQQLVIYKTLTFGDGIEQIDSCVVYHSGPDYVVEVDIVMAAETPLWKVSVQVRVELARSADLPFFAISKAHDVSQALQDKLEEMPRVSRCHVHVDYETTHKPEHRKTR